MTHLTLIRSPGIIHCLSVHYTDKAEAERLVRHAAMRKWEVVESRPMTQAEMASAKDREAGRKREEAA